MTKLDHDPESVLTPINILLIENILLMLSLRLKENLSHFQKYFLHCGVNETQLPTRA